MSNIAKVIEFIKAEPDYNKDAMVEKIMASLNVTKSNAQVYIYNAVRKIGVAPTKTDKVAAKVAKSVVAKAAKTSKYLPGQVAKPVKGEKKDRSQVLSEMAKIEAEMEEFERTHEMHSNGILMIKKKNLETMKKVSKRLAKEQREDKEREAEFNDYVHGANASLTREDLRELGL